MSAPPPSEGDSAEQRGDQAQDDIDDDDDNNHNNTTQEGNRQGTPRDPNMDDEQFKAEVKEQDRWLPIANVARIMKTALPDNAKIAKEAKECMQECVSEFISFVTSEASEKCQQEKRKTVNGEDILFAMTSLGFENYSEALKIYLARFRQAYMNKMGIAQPRPGVDRGSQSAVDASDAAQADESADANAQIDPDDAGLDEMAKQAAKSKISAQTAGAKTEGIDPDLTSTQEQSHAEGALVDPPDALGDIAGAPINYSI